MNNAALAFRSNLVASGVHLDTVSLTARVELEGRLGIGHGALKPLFLSGGTVAGIVGGSDHPDFPNLGEQLRQMSVRALGEEMSDVWASDDSSNRKAMFGEHLKPPLLVAQPPQRQTPVRAYGESALGEHHFQQASPHLRNSELYKTLVASRDAADHLAHAKSPLQVIGQRSWSFMAEATKKNSAILQHRFKKALGHNRHNRKFANNANQPKRNRKAWQ